MIKEFSNVPFDLYILKSDIKKMEKGDSGIGYILVDSEEKNKYELIKREAFQPIRKQDILDGGIAYDVVFIYK